MAQPKTEDHLFLVDTIASKSGDELVLTVVCRIPRYDGWRILAEFAETERGRELRRIVVEPEGDMPLGGIPTRLLLRLRAGELKAALGVAQLHNFAPAEPVAKRSGRRGRDESWYAQWAQAYAAAAATSLHPVAELAAREHLSQSQVRNIVYACRSRGMLTEAPPGRAGGLLTDKARRLLDGIDR